VRDPGAARAPDAPGAVPFDGTRLAPSLRMRRPGRSPCHRRLPPGWPLAAVLAVGLLPPVARAVAVDATRPPAARAGAGAVPALAWQPTADDRSEARAVALDRPGQRMAVGFAVGLAWGDVGGPLSTRALRAEATALLFDATGALWVGTRDGLFRQTRDGPLLDRSPTGREGSRAVRRLAAAPGVLAVATDGGVFVSPGGSHWRRLDVPRAPRAIALDRAGGVTRILLLGEGVALALELATGPEGVTPMGPPRDLGLDASLRGPALEVRADLASAGLVVATPERLAIRAPGSDQWRVERPGLPPGARITRLAPAAGRLLLATDRGLFAAVSLQGPWSRIAARAVGVAVHDVAGSPSLALAATASGGVLGTPDAAAAVASAPPPGSPGPGGSPAVAPAARVPGYGGERRLPSGPPVQELYRAALEHLGLHPAHFRRLRRGLAVRGLLPRVDLSLERGRSYGQRSDYDEAYVSGGLRRLFDRQHDRDRDVAAGIELSWDLGDLAYHPESVDLSREARSVIQLRDDVLDEIARLHFERRRVLLELASHADPWSLEAERLRLRADELAAGLDAWTGGWFGRRAPALSRGRPPAASASAVPRPATGGQ